MWWQIFEAWKQFERLRQEAIKFQASPGYTAKPYLKLTLKSVGNAALG